MKQVIPNSKVENSIRCGFRRVRALFTLLGGLRRVLLLALLGGLNATLGAELGEVAPQSRAVWASNAAKPGEDHSSVGRSLFDHLMTRDVGGRGVYDIIH